MSSSSLVLPTSVSAGIIHPKVRARESETMIHPSPRPGDAEETETLKLLKHVTIQRKLPDNLSPSSPFICHGVVNQIRRVSESHLFISNMKSLLSLILTLSLTRASPLLSWLNPTFSWFYSNNGVLDPSKITLNQKIVPGR